uniref:Laminin subunit gamma 2 n=1 Tax=Cyanistes caeruleus TaxID=156563 RepID=A0A8C0ZIG6_CYACU
MAECWLLTVACLAAFLLPAALSTRSGEDCDCNGMSRQCIFDWQLLRETGNGYRCLGCLGNTEGTHCERCKDGFFRRWGEQCCLPCLCHTWGSLSPQCDSDGRCSCKPGVMGDKCDRCQLGFESLSEAGSIKFIQGLLSSCECDPAGSMGACQSGLCVCKESTTGERCQRCKQHFYNLDARNPAGCSPCFCYGHSVTCISADNHSVHNITSTFQQGTEGWRGVHESGSPAQLQWSPRHQDVFIAARRSEPIYFVAPAKFLGNQQLSYGQMLSFDYRLDRGGQQPSPHDVVLEGHGLRVTAPFLPQGKVLPCGISQMYTFRLDEHPSSKWSPRLNHFEFRRLLGNLTALWIRATFGEYSTGYIDNVTLVSARPVPGAPAPWVERCQCPAAYRGQFCESCAPGYRRNAPGQGPFSVCVPCNCQGGGICDPDTGECYSGDENVGNGVSCPFGSYRDAQQPYSCRTCPCRLGQGCSVGPGSEEVVCDDCPPGAVGANCEYCADGYFGDPAASQPCQLCQCNGNVEPNAVGNCDRRTGECLKCLYNTTGFYCDRCKDGFFGNPLAPDPAHKCRACACDSVGAEPVKCRSDGSCLCKPGFEGPRCEDSECPACYGHVKVQVSICASPRATKQQELEGFAAWAFLHSNEFLFSLSLSFSPASGRSMEGRVTQMKGQGSSSQSRLDEIKAAMETLRSLGNLYERQVQETRQLLERARLDLEHSGATLRWVVRASHNKHLGTDCWVSSSPAPPRLLWDHVMLPYCVLHLLFVSLGTLQKLTQLLSRATLARSTALQAMSAGNATFYEVEQILKSLKEFNLQADDKRREAKDDMRRLPIISSMVTTAREKTDQAKGIVDSAASESKAGSSVVGEVKEIVMGIQEEIAQLKGEANKTADGVLALEKAVATLQHEAKEGDDAFERKLLEVEADAAVIEKETQRVHDKAGQAGGAVQQMLSTLEELLHLMNQPGAMDEDGLRQLEANFRKAKNRSKQLKVEMSELEQTTALQKDRVRMLESGIDDILSDIKNLEDIQNSLPPGCYNTKAIELP